MKVIIKVSNSGEFKDVEFIGEPTDIQVEVMEEE